MKYIKVNGVEIKAEKWRGLWVCRYMDTMIILPTLRELKEAISKITESLITKYN